MNDGFAVEIVSIDRIGIALTKETHVVGILQLFEARWIAPKLLVKVLNRAHVRVTAMSKLYLAVSDDLLFDCRHHGRQCDQHESQRQDQRDHHVTALLILGVL